jgi:hypothetical protein
MGKIMIKNIIGFIIGVIFKYRANLLHIIIGFIIGVISSYVANQLHERRKKKKIKKEMEKRLEELKKDEFIVPGSKIIVNLSGHPMKLFEENWNKDKDPSIDINFSINEENLVEEAIRLFCLIPEDIRFRIKCGEDVIFALPGLSKLAVLLITIIHAYSGKFPVITTAIRSKDGSGFIWQKPIDLYKLRIDNRLLRIIR